MSKPLKDQCGIQDNLEEMSEKGKATENRETLLYLKAHTEFKLKPKPNIKLSKPVSERVMNKMCQWKTEQQTKKSNGLTQSVCEERANSL